MLKLKINKNYFKILKSFLIIFYLVLDSMLFAEILAPDVNSVSIKLDQYIDCANLEYDDSPYPGRTNLGHIFIPYLQINTKPVELNIGGWYKHIYVSFDEDDSPEKMYPYMNAVFTPWNKSEFLIGNFLNLSGLPNTIYNEFIFFEQRPVSSGLKFSVKNNNKDLLTYIDWIELDTKEHPEEFITGIIWKHNIFSHFYYKFFNHYHHRGGQLNKDTHPVRIEQDIVFSPVMGFIYSGLYLETEYYLSTFSQNFEPSIYGHAASCTLGYETDSFNLSYQCFYNRDYYHQDAHPFYLKKRNTLNRIRLEYNIYRYKELLDLIFTTNLYGMDPPGIDFRLFAKINLNIFKYANNDTGYIHEEPVIKNKGNGQF